MKKLMILLAIGFVSCQKQTTCIDCQSANSSVQGCKGVDFSNETDMAEIVNVLQQNGYQCEIYYE